MSSNAQSTDNTILWTRFFCTRTRAWSTSGNSGITPHTQLCVVCAPITATAHLLLPSSPYDPDNLKLVEILGWILQACMQGWKTSFHLSADPSSAAQPRGGETDVGRRARRRYDTSVGVVVVDNKSSSSSK